MGFGLFALPFGLIQTALIAVVIILIIKAFTGSKHAGRAVATTLALAAAAVMVLVILSIVMLFVRVAVPVVHQTRQAHVVAPEVQIEAAIAETEHVRAGVEQMAEEVRAKADEIRRQAEAEVDRIHAATVPGVVEVPDVPVATAIELTNVEDKTYEDPTTGLVEANARVATPDEIASYEDPTTAHVAAGTLAATPEELASHDDPVARHASGVLIAGQPWSGAVEEHQDFEADLYPSLEAAAEALGRRVGQQLMQAAEMDDGTLPYIYVWRDEADGGDAAFITRDVLEAVASGLRQKLFDPAHVSVERPVSGIAVRVAIQEVKFENHNRWRSKAESRSGGLALRVTPGNAHEAFSLSTRFAEAPWIVDRTSFAKDYSNGDWLVAYSDGTHTTHDEARWDALHKAADSVLPLAETRISRMSGSDQQRFRQQLAKDPNWLRDRVTDELVSRNLATDRFTQQFVRPYGSVWREVVLVDASPDRIEDIARSVVQGVNVQATHHRNTWFSFIALGMLIFGTYLFLNMATKGYYAWMLRGALLVGLVVLGMVILSFA